MAPSLMVSERVLRLFGQPILWMYLCSNTRACRVVDGTLIGSEEIQEIFSKRKSGDYPIRLGLARHLCIRKTSTYFRPLPLLFKPTARHDMEIAHDGTYPSGQRQFLEHTHMDTHVGQCYP